MKTKPIHDLQRELAEAEGQWWTDRVDRQGKPLDTRYPPDVVALYVDEDEGIWTRFEVTVGRDKERGGGIALLLTNPEQMRYIRLKRREGVDITALAQQMLGQQIGENGG